MIKIAKLDPNNKVLGVYLMSDSSCRDKNTGEITIESCDLAAESLFGPGNYVPDLTPETHGTPNLGFNYDPVNKVFFEDKPKDPETNQEYTSWTLNIEKGIWEAPHRITDWNGIVMPRWKESEQKFKAKKGPELKQNENSNWYEWNNITKQWENTNSNVF